MTKTKITLIGYLEECALCGVLMMPKRSASAEIFKGTVTLEDQMKANGWVFEGSDLPGTDHDDTVCERCTKAGKITFTCFICKQERTSDLLHEDQYGEPECTVCYETMPAKAWDEWQEKQNARNRWYYSS